MHEAPIVGLVVLVGVLISWRVVAGVAVLWLSFPLRYKAEQKWPPGLKPKWYRTAIDMAVSSVVLAILGGVILGGIGVIFGFFLGIVFALSSIPLSVKNPKAGEAAPAGAPEPERLELTLQNSPRTAKALTIAGLASPVVLLLICVLLIVTHR
jgi:hypothetical protein